MDRRVDGSLMRFSTVRRSVNGTGQQGMLLYALRQMKHDLTNPTASWPLTSKELGSNLQSGSGPYWSAQTFCKHKPGMSSC